MTFKRLEKSIDIIDLLCYTIGNNSCIILTLENVWWVKNQYSGGLPVKMVYAFLVSNGLFVVLVLNLTDYELLSQSEEHGVLRVKNWKDLKVGDVLYGVPFHICPTINLHDDLSVIKNHKKIDTWPITARKRKLEI